MHIHPVVKGLGAGTVLRQDERYINSFLVLDSHVPVVSCATIFDLVWTGRHIGLDTGEYGAIGLFFLGKISPVRSLSTMRQIEQSRRGHTNATLPGS